jgi:hypothetical protein
VPLDNRLRFSDFSVDVRSVDLSALHHRLRIGGGMAQLERAEGRRKDRISVYFRQDQAGSVVVGTHLPRMGTRMGGRLSSSKMDTFRRPIAPRWCGARRVRQSLLACAQP